MSKQSERVMQNDNSLLYLLMGLIVGIVVAVLFASSAVNKNDIAAMRMMGITRSEQTMVKSKTMDGKSTEEMLDMFKDKVGDTRDKAFVDAEIINHQGSITMAEYIKTRTDDKQIKDLATRIITTQSKEILFMKTLISKWK